MEKIKNLRIDGPNGRPIMLDIFYTNGKKPAPVVLFCHGFKGFKDWGTFNKIGEYFANEDFVFVKFNFSFNGTTLDNPDEITDTDAFSENNFTKELDDLKKVLDWLENNDVITGEIADLNNLSLIGHSRGGAVSLIKAYEDDRVKKVVSWAAPRDLSAGWKDEELLRHWKKGGVFYVENRRTGDMYPLKYQLVEDYKNNVERFNLENAIRKMEKPIMVVHGTEDETIPFEDAIEMKRWNTAVNMELIPHANHTFGGFHPYEKEDLPLDLSLVLELTVKFIKGIPERRRRKRT